MGGQNKLELRGYMSDKTEKEEELTIKHFGGEESRITLKSYDNHDDGAFVGCKDPIIIIDMEADGGKYNYDEYKTAEASRLISLAIDLLKDLSYDDSDLAEMKQQLLDIEENLYTRAYGDNDEDN